MIYNRTLCLHASQQVLDAFEYESQTIQDSTSSRLAYTYHNICSAPSCTFHWFTKHKIYIIQGEAFIRTHSPSRWVHALHGHRKYFCMFTGWFRSGYSKTMLYEKGKIQHYLEAYFKYLDSYILNQFQVWIRYSSYTVIHVICIVSRRHK